MYAAHGEAIGQPGRMQPQKPAQKRPACAGLPGPDLRLSARGAASIVRAGYPERLSLGEHLDRAWMQDWGRIEPGPSRVSLRADWEVGGGSWEIRRESQAGRDILRTRRAQIRPSGPGNYQE